MKLKGYMISNYFCTFLIYIIHLVFSTTIKSSFIIRPVIN